MTGGNTSAKDYFSRAFEFSRVFLFKWTVNWRFVGEERFYSKQFSYGLLAGHFSLLSTFITTRWLRPSNWTLPEAIGVLLNPPPKEHQARISKRVTPDFIFTSVLSAVIIGCLCARSLHYQFFVYIAWSTPYLLWRSGVHPVLIYIISSAQEYGWNVYPSTNQSSMIVVGCLALTVVATWLGTSSSSDSRNVGKQNGHIKHEHAQCLLMPGQVALMKAMTCNWWWGRILEAEFRRWRGIEWDSGKRVEEKEKEARDQQTLPA